MDPQFWHERWRTRQIGFHQSSPHPFLERWWPSLELPDDARVYVPLCGKSLDMVWLSVRGHPVVGSELSAVAVEEFFGERGAQAAVETVGPFRRHVSGRCEIFEGDALALTPELLGPVRAAYDRAALVSLPPPMRARYAAVFASLLSPGAKALLVAFEYPQPLREGPPFSVEPDEVRRLYGDAFAIEEVERLDIIADSPKFAAAGVDALYEVVYRLTRR